MKHLFIGVALMSGFYSNSHGRHFGGLDWTAKQVRRIVDNNTKSRLKNQNTMKNLLVSHEKLNEQYKSAQKRSCMEQPISGEWSGSCYSKKNGSTKNHGLTNNWQLIEKRHMKISTDSRPNQSTLTMSFPGAVLESPIGAPLDKLSKPKCWGIDKETDRTRQGSSFKSTLKQNIDIQFYTQNEGTYAVVSADLVSELESERLGAIKAADSSHLCILKKNEKK